MADSGTQKKNRIYSLDFLRIVATLGILIYHYEQVFDYRARVINLTEYFNGSLIVEFFFVLSGFLAFYDLERLRGNSYSFSGYMIRKYARLIPVIIMPCLAYTFLCFLFRTLNGNGGWFFDTAVDIPATIAAAAGVQFWGILNGNYINYPLWYVDVLIFCYIVYAAIIKISARLKLQPLYGFTAVIITGMIFVNAESKLPILNMHMARGYCAFFAGVIFALIYAHVREDMVKSVWLLLLNLLIAALTLTFIVIRPYWFGENNRYILTFITYPALISVFLNPSVQKIFNHKWLGYAGMVTYDIYAWHLVVYFAVFYKCMAGIINLKIDSVVTLIVAIASSVVMGVLSYHFVDRFVRWVITSVKKIFV